MSEFDYQRGLRGGAYKGGSNGDYSQDSWNDWKDGIDEYERRIREEEDARDREIRREIAETEQWLSKQEVVPKPEIKQFTAREHYELGLKSADNQNYLEAKNHFSKAIEMIPRFVDAQYQRGSTNIDLLLFDEAVSDLTKAIEIEPNVHKHICERATAYFYKRDYSSAVKDCDKSIGLDKSCTTPYILLGIIKAEQGDRNGALDYFRKALKINDTVDSKFLVMSNFLDNHNLKKESLKILNCAIELNQNNHDFYCNRGAIKVELNDYVGGITDLNRAIELNSKCVRAFAKRGYSKLKIDDIEGAREDSLIALSFDQNYQLAKENIKNIDEFVEEKRKVRTKAIFAATIWAIATGIISAIFINFYVALFFGISAALISYVIQIRS